VSYGNYGQPPPPGGYGYGPQQPNPYAPPQPQAAFAYGGAGAGGPVRVPGSAMKWTYGVSLVFGVFLFIGIFVVAGIMSNGRDPGDTADAAAGMSIGLAGLLAMACFPLMLIAGMVWLYKSWGCVPPQMRYTDGGKWVTPGAAVGFLFVPFYNWYWVFVANVGLCEAINRTLVASGGQPRAPRGLAIAACIVALIPYVNYLSPIMWTVYMFVMDSAKKELVSRTGVGAY
jgi:hypothetical protein